MPARLTSPWQCGQVPELMLYLPASGLLFTGDVMMPYRGAELAGIEIGPVRCPHHG